MEIQHRDSPDLLFFNIEGEGVDIDKVIRVTGGKRARILAIRGVLYTDGQHYTARVVDWEGLVWFHDGIFTGRSPVYESHDLASITTENAIMAFYIRSPA